MALRKKIDGDVISFLEQDGRAALTILEQERDGGVVLTVEGELGSGVGHDFNDELMALAVLGLDIVLELTKTTYLSTDCMQSMLSAQRKLDSLGGGSLTLRSVPPAILREMESIGLSDLLLIED